VALVLHEDDMTRRMFRSKIHRAVVTEANLNYEGSVSIDVDLMDAADILPNEEVHIWNVTNGSRLVTYAIPAESGSGVICLNGAAARLGTPGDRVIVLSYCLLDEEEAKRSKPRLVFVDDGNRPR